MEDNHIIIDVYHHYDESVEKLIHAFTKLLENPIEVKIINEGSLTPTHIVLNPGIPQTNKKET